MKVISNQKLIKRNARLGQIASFGGLLVLAGGMFISFKYIQYASLSWVALLVGFALSQVGLYFTNRWGRHPRPDEKIDESLKGLNDQFSIYHYKTPASHLLVGPTGLWVIMPYFQAGNITYEKGRWRQKGGSFFQKYLRFFGQEGIGRPDVEAPAEVESLTRYLKKNLSEESFTEPRIVLVFTSDKAELDVSEAPILTLPLKKLKEAVKKANKEYLLTPTLIQDINNLFD